MQPPMVPARGYKMPPVLSGSLPAMYLLSLRCWFVSGVVPDPVVPLYRRVFRDQRGKRRHVCDERVVVAAGLEEHHLVARQRESARERPATRPGTHDDIFDRGIGRQRHRPRLTEQSRDADRGQ